MKELTINERAKRGIPNLAITRERTFTSRLEGFDCKGHYWYKTMSSHMEPLIEKGSYLCLKPMKTLNGLCGINGEVYLLAIRQFSGDIVTIVGHIVNKPVSDTITIATTSPFPCSNDFKRSQIIEAYKVLYTLTPLPV